MTAYTKSTNFATKDTLTSGDPLKIVKGTEINTEFDNIATAVNSKSDTASPTFTGTVTIPTLTVSGVISATSPNITTSITTPSTSFDLLNTTATTLNLGGAATAVNVGAATGTMTVANTTLAAKAITASTTLGVTGTTTLTGVATLTANPVLSAGTANGVTYLNASKSLTSGTGLVFDGTNLGIGTSSPGSKLDVTGNYITIQDGTYTGYLGKASSLVSGGAADLALRSQGQLYFSTGGATTRMLIDSIGNVGIGVTPSASETSGGSLYFSSALISSAASGAATIAYNSTGNSKYVATGFASQYYQLSGTHVWRTAPSGTAGAAITFTQAMTLDASGNLGIGTTSTGGYALAIERTSNNALLKLTAVTTGGAGIDLINAGGSEVSYVGTGTSGQALTFRAGSTTDRMRLDASGNLQMLTGAVMPYAPAPAAISAAATLTNANIQGQIISATGTTYTITMPLGSTMETLATWAATNIAYDFFVINTATGIITMAVNTGVTSLGALTVAIGASAHFRIRRTAANTFVLYRLV